LQVSSQQPGQQRSLFALTIAGALFLPSCSREPPPPAPHPPGAPVAQAPRRAAPGPGTRIHRQGAGVPDETGWCLARSTEGGFSVRLPAAFNDSTVTSPADGGAFVSTYLLGTTTDTGARFAAFKAQRSDGRINVVSPEAIADRFEREGKLRTRRPIVHDGLDGIEFEVEDQGQREVFRCFLQDGAIYQLSVQGSKADYDAGVEALEDRFFESFRAVALP